ncbi:MAG: hypothetical protein AB1774_09525 [Bacillota bacterium]
MFGLPVSRTAIVQLAACILAPILPAALGREVVIGLVTPGSVFTGVLTGVASVLAVRDVATALTKAILAEPVVATS